MKMENNKFLNILRSKPESFRKTINETIEILKKLNAKIDEKKFL